MTVKFNLDMSKWDSEFFSDALDRIESGADVIRDKARVKLKAAITAARKGENSLAGERWREHGPYKTGKNAGATWTERYHGEMAKTIRTVRSKDPTNKSIWVMAGQYKHWWAIQLEYGHGKWKGGAKPFFRPALRESMSSVIAICEGGGGSRAVK
jgi:hypothetical protein